MANNPIRELRQERGWTQTALAAAAGIGQGAVSEAERGGPIGRSIQFRISQALDVTTHDIIPERS